MVTVTHAKVSAISPIAPPTGIVTSADWNADHIIDDLESADVAFTQTGTGAIEYSVSTKIGAVFSVTDFGTVGDGVTDDIAALEAATNAAIAAASATYGQATLTLTRGNYAVSRVWEVGHTNLHIIALDGAVVIKRIGTPGKVVSFDAGSIVKNQTFGGPNVICIEGNNIGTEGIYINRMENSSIRVNVRNVSSRVINTTVATEVDYEIQSSANDGAFTTVPAFGCLFDQQNGCRYFLKVEGVGGSDYGATFTNSGALDVFGTVEGCLTGGIRIDSNCTNIKLDTVDSEANNTTYDFNIAGSGHVIINCRSGLTPSGSGNASTYTTWIGNQIATLTNFVGSTKNVFLNNRLSSFVDNEPTTYRIGNSGVADKFPLGGTTTSDNATTGNVGEYIFSSGPSTLNVSTVTITIATPAVVTWGTTLPFTGLGNYTSPVVFTTTGSLPTGIVAGTQYWLIGTSVSGNTFQIATSAANALAAVAVATSGSQSGVQTGTGGVPLSTGTAATVAAISLTAGDWDVEGVVAYNSGAAGTTSVTVSCANLGIVVNTLDTTPGKFIETVTPATIPAANAGSILGVPTYRLSLAATATVFLNALSIFTVSTNGGSGRVAARRAR